MNDFVGLPIMIRSRGRKSLGLLTGIKGFGHDPNFSFRDLDPLLLDNLLRKNQLFKAGHKDELFVLMRRSGVEGEWVVVPHDVLITAWHETWTHSNRGAVLLGDDLERLVAPQAWDPEGFCPHGEWFVMENGDL